jgi:hypothetical protein
VVTFWLFVAATHLSAAAFGAGIVLLLQERRRSIDRARELTVADVPRLAARVDATQDEKRRYAEFRRRIDEDVRGAVEQADREV